MKLFENTWATVTHALSLKSYFSYQDIAKFRWNNAENLKECLNQLKDNAEKAKNNFYKPSYRTNLQSFYDDFPWQYSSLDGTYYYSGESNDRRELNATELANALRTNARTLRFESRKERILSYIMPAVSVCVLPIELCIALVKDFSIAYIKYLSPSAVLRTLWDNNDSQDARDTTEDYKDLEAELKERLEYLNNINNGFQETAKYRTRVNNARLGRDSARSRRKDARIIRDAVKLERDRSLSKFSSLFSRFVDLPIEITKYVVIKLPVNLVMIAVRYVTDFYDSYDQSAVGKNEPTNTIEGNNDNGATSNRIVVNSLKNNPKSMTFRHGTNSINESLGVVNNCTPRPVIVEEEQVSRTNRSLMM